MSITYRSVKGDELEHHEVDENFKYLDEKSSNYEVGHVYRGSVIRIYNGHLYLLSSSVTFPFTATNFATELAAGNWLLIGSSSSYKGELNLTAPVLTNGVGVVGDYYKVVEAGDYDFGAGDIAFKVGDFVFYDGSVYGPYVDNNQLFSTNYLKKTFDKIQTHVGTGTNVVIPLNTTGYRNIYLQGAMTSVAGFSFDNIIAAPETSEFPHDGKEYVLWNKSGHNITLKNEIIANDVSFSFKEGTDLVVPDNECVVFMNDTNVFFERDRSWDGLNSSKLDKVSTVDVQKVYVKNADGTQGMKPVSEFGGVGVLNYSWSAINFTALNTWKTWYLGNSLNGNPTLNYGTATIPLVLGNTSANDVSVFAIHNRKKINGITLNIRHIGGGGSYYSLQAYIVVADYAFVRGNETNGQVIVNQVIETTMQGSNSLIFTINAHNDLATNSVMYVFFRTVSGPATINLNTCDFNIF